MTMSNTIDIKPHISLTPEEIANFIIELKTKLGEEKITVGKWGIVSGGSSVIRDIKEYCMYAGVPAKMKKTLK